jgi:hypothetical protein
MSAPRILKQEAPISPAEAAAVNALRRLLGPRFGPILTVAVVCDAHVCGLTLQEFQQEVSADWHTFCCEDRSN